VRRRIPEPLEDTAGEGQQRGHKDTGGELPVRDTAGEGEEGYPTFERYSGEGQQCGYKDTGGELPVRDTGLTPMIRVASTGGTVAWIDRVKGALQLLSNRHM